MRIKFTHLIWTFLIVCLLGSTIPKAHAFPWGLLSKLGSAAGKAGASAAKVGTSAAKAGGAAAKAGTAAKVGGAAAKVGVGKATTMTAAGAVAGDAAVGGKAVAGIGASADDLAVGSRAAALGSVTDDGGRAAALGGEAASEVPMGKFNTRRRVNVGAEAGAEASTEGRWSDHAADAADAASNVVSYDSEDEANTSAEEEIYQPGFEWTYVMMASVLLFALAIYVTKKGKRN